MKPAREVIRSHPKLVNLDRTLQFMFEAVDRFPGSQLILRHRASPFRNWWPYGIEQVARAAEVILFGLSEGLLEIQPVKGEPGWRLLYGGVTFVPHRDGDGTNLSTDIRSIEVRSGLIRREASFRLRKARQLHDQACRETELISRQVADGVQVPGGLASLGFFGFASFSEARQYLLDHQRTSPAWKADAIWTEVVSILNRSGGLPSGTAGAADLLDTEAIRQAMGEL